MKSDVLTLCKIPSMNNGKVSVRSIRIILSKKFLQRAQPTHINCRWCR